MRNSITYAGVNSASVGLVVEKYPSMNRPARKFDKVSVKGRNGDIYFMQDAFSNVEQEYEIWCPKGQFSDVLNFLYPEERGTTVEDILRLEVNGYKQLQDSYDPNVTRLACVTNGFDVENLRNRFARATITFDCRPERFTADAFDWVDVGEEQTTKSGEIVTFDPAVIIEAGQGKNKADVDDTTVTDSRWFAELTDLTPSGTYTISFDYVRTGEVTIAIVTSTYNYFPLTATSGRFSGTVTATTMGAISVACDEITGSLSVSKFQCEEGSEATDYEPYELVADLDTAPYVQNLTASINAVQNLNGYDKPWVGGAGKNKLPPVTPPTSLNGVTISVDSKGVINVNGTTTANTYFDIGSFSVSNPPTDGTYILNGSVGGSGTTWRINLYKGSSVAGQSSNGDSASVSLTASDTNVRATIYINSGVTLNNVKFYPMLRLSTVSDSTYEPYENICPISGYSSVNVVDCGKNLLNGVVWTRGYFINASGVITSATANMYSSPIPVTAGEYTYNYTRTTSTSITTRIHACDKHGNWIRQIASFTSNTVDDYNNTITVPSDVEWVIISTGNNTLHLNLNYFCLTDNIPVESYSEGSGVHTISLGSTIYGGTLDVTSGVLTVTHHKYQFTGGATLQGNINDSHYAYSMADQPSDIPTGSYWEGICDLFECALAANQRINGRFYIISNRVIFVSDLFTDLETADALLKEWKPTVVYPVTPYEVQLTPTQVQTVLGQNNLWADSGTVTVVINKPIANPSPRNARPCLKVYGSGSGTVVCNGYVINISNIPSYIYIDSDSQNCFKEISDANLNNLVTLTSGFPVLSAGGNSISWSGGVTNVEVMPRWWNL